MVTIFFALNVLTMEMIDCNLFVLYRSNIYTKFIYLITISLGSYPTCLPTRGLHVSQSRPALRTTNAVTWYTFFYVSIAPLPRLSYVNILFLHMKRRGAKWSEGGKTGHKWLWTIASMQMYQWPWWARHSMPCIYICSPCCTVCWTRSRWRMRCPPHYHWIDSVLTLIKFQVLTWACSLWSTRCSTPSDCMLSLIMFQVLTRTCSLWSTPYDCSVCMLTLVMFQVWTWPRSRWGTRCSPHYYCIPTLYVSGLNLTPKWLGDEVLTSLWLHANTRCVSGFDLNPVAGGTRCSLHYDCSDCMLTIIRFVT